ncbi:hypothetical protein GQ44DRAFT_769508 [Phaeosphaeriaceae sp. PMI808]|nr:hypothetical protein GQ44DRAFT_769508 [Phaeosphaeriaceae sp. PMI808]
MTSPSVNALFCDNIGKTSSDVRCCYIDNQTAPICRQNFNASGPIFSGGCNNGNCILQCQNPKWLYKSDSQDDPSTGNGQAPIQRFRTCANVPAIAGFAAQGSLSEEIASLVGRHVPFDAPAASLRSVTSVVTECLTQTCKASRNQRACSGACSAVNMLKSSTIPDIGGVNECLNKLCTGNYDSLPYADADVVGIGVFSSYILQCILIVLLWFGLFSFERHNHKHPVIILESMNEKPSKLTPPQQATPQTISPLSGVSSKMGAEEITHQSLLETCLVQFHVSQCYFSATIQIASLAYGIFSTDMLITFMLLPISISGVLPIIFGFLLLFRHGRDSMDVTLLTVACWLLSSIVYWVLYAHIIPINARFASEYRRYIAYQQLTYKLSALDSCGGYSALAVCPNNFSVGKEEVTSASQKLSYLTPIIWSFSTICLLLVLGAKVANWHREWRNLARRRQGSQKEGAGHMRAGSSALGREQSHAQNTVVNSSLLEEIQINSEDEHDRYQQRQSHTTRPAVSVPPHKKIPTTFLRSDRSLNTMWAITTPCFLAGIGIQISLLSISTSLKMMNRNDWGFGQIVAIAVWVPPLLQYMYDEFKKSVVGRLKVRWALEEEGTKA